MPILVDGRSLVDSSPGGVTRVARGILPALFSARSGDRFTLVTSGSDRPTLPFALPSHVTHRHIALPNKIWSAGTVIGAWALDKWFRDETFDLTLLPNIGFVGRLTRPYALIVHDLSFLIEPRWFSWKGRFWHQAVHATRLMKCATHLFAVSERTKYDLQEFLHIPENRITTIPLGLPPGVAFTNLPPLLQDKRFVLALGMDDARKNAGCAVAAVEALHRDPKFSDVVLVLTGASATTYNLQPTNSILLSRPADVALNTLMQHASAFLYPSWYEGFGLPLHEAARFGTPCIASTAGALPETAPAGTLFAPPSKPHLWAEALAMILDDPSAHGTSTRLTDWTQAAQITAQKLRMIMT